jgi:hypothetical protein
MNIKGIICFFILLFCINLYSIKCEENTTYITIINEFSEIVQKYYDHKMEINSVGLENIIDFLNDVFLKSNNYKIELKEDKIEFTVNEIDNEIELSVINEYVIKIEVFNNEVLLAHFTFTSYFSHSKSALGMNTHVIGQIYINDKIYQMFLGHFRNYKICLLFFDKNDENYIYINYFSPNEEEMFIEEKYTNTEYFLETSKLLEKRIIYNNSYYN